MMFVLNSARVWDRNTQSDTAAGLEAHERAKVEALPVVTEPVTAPPARFGFGGIRKELERLVNLTMPPVPQGPARIIAHRAAAPGAGRPAVMTTAPAATLAPVRTVEQSTPWYEYLAQ